MKLGLDFHGVIDKHPKFFAELTALLVNNLWKVHIITGTKLTPEFRRKLDDFGIKYTHLFSIVDYHESIGTPVNYDERGPWIDADLWNKTKAEYCKRENISFHIDDSDVYGKFFTDTIYLQLKRPEE